MGLIKTKQQIEGIIESANINTAVLDHVAAHIKAGMTTEDINKLVHDFTVAHGAIPAPLNYQRVFVFLLMMLYVMVFQVKMLSLKMVILLT